MQLKDYQNDVLESLSRYHQALAARREEADEVLEFQRSKGRDAKLADYCRETWDALHAQKALPLMKDKDGHTVAPPYVARKDGLERPVPNICLKVPTGGGKTLLGTVAVERINAEYFKKQTGFVLWIVPSDAIYSQTWKAFANREHPYRQMLERASGGRVRLLEKSDRFTKQDVDEQLCVMLMMLQAGSVKKESKEARKMFQDSGKFPSFFPDVDDAIANKALLQQVPNLDAADLTEEGFRIGGLTVRQSLANVLRLVRPLVLIDEGHKAYSNTALEFIAEHNPRFILELSATPNSGKEYVSNVLVNITGTALKDEQMIKLPINLDNQNRADWKHTLSVAQDKLAELQKDAEHVRNNEGRYIRPILLIRVERTGKEQRDKSAIHSEDVREYLVEKLGAQPDEVKVKSAEMDELGDENLLSELSKVRYIITKDALREGWDCPFAYVLAVLSKTTATTALTQMIGRVLRQPEAKLTGTPALNECYVFTFDQEVQAAVDSVRRGLEEEGMGDLAANVRATGKGAAAASRRETLRRRKEFAGLKIFLPRVLSRHYATGEWRQFDYDRDLLSRLDWARFSYTNRATYTPDEKETIERTLTRVDGVIIAGGVASTAIPVQPNWFDGQTRYLGISINGSAELTPRVLITAVPYSLATRGIVVDPPETFDPPIVYPRPSRRTVLGTTTEDISRIPKADEALIIGTTNGAAGTTVGIYFDTLSRADSAIVVEKNNGSNIEDTSMHFYVGNDGELAAKRAMTISHNGTVGIGTSVPQAKLEVIGDTRMEVTSGQALQFISDGGIVPGITASGGSVPGTMRFRDSLEIWPSSDGIRRFGKLDLRNPQGIATVQIHGGSKFNDVDNNGHYGRVTVNNSAGVEKVILSGDAAGGPTLALYPSLSNGRTISLYGGINGGDASIHCDGIIHATSFNTTSDRNLKQDIESVDPIGILDKVCSLPTSSWRFKAAPNTRHIGPMAQDFHAAFDVGEDDKHIATVDADGVALAAIQGLNQKVEMENSSLRSALKAKDAELDALHRAVAELKEAVSRLTPQIK